MQLQLAPETVIAGALAFARIGGLVMLMPGLGERVLPARQRLMLALALAMIVLPDTLAAASRLKVPTLQLFITEALIGLALGTCARLILTTMETAGSLIASNIGLAFAQIMDPAQGQQSEILATFFRMAGVAFILAADLHHLALAGVVGSYQGLPVGVVLPTGDVIALVLRIVSETFRTAVAIASPFIVFGLVFNLGLGLASKLTPQLQLFFVAMPLSILLGLAALALTFDGAGHRFLGLARELFTLILPGA
jgi:flagellar biosynthetic protein FliR